MRVGVPEPRGWRELSQLAAPSGGRALASGTASPQPQFTLCLLRPCSASTVGSFNRQCLSCDLVENCTYFSASFSHNMDFFLLKCEGTFQPQFLAQL